MNKLCILLIAIPSLIFGESLQHSYIRDTVQHCQNQKILKNIIQKELASAPDTSPEERADYLIARIHQIAASLLKEGFRSSAYDAPKAGPKVVMAYDSFALWEGETIPVTFFAYVWPSEKSALQFNSYENYATVIHSHPIKCSLSVLNGEVVQKSFELIDAEAKTVRLINEQLFKVGEGEIDLLTKPFIHQLFNRGTQPSITLHAYALETAEKVKEYFKETLPKYSYSLE